jgi:transcriptional regulator GlxA family with amidase domain
MSTSRRLAEPDTRQVAVIGYRGAELLDIACVVDTFDMANRFLGRPHYRLRILSPGGEPIACTAAVTLESHGALEHDVGPLDTLVVAGGWGPSWAGNDPLLVAHVRRLARSSRRIASVCTGAAVLAAGGLLDGRRATTHWEFAARFAQLYPRVEVDDDPIFIQDGDTYTAAGVTSALDLTLAFVTEDHGAALARQVARSLVTYLQRPGNQAQMSIFMTAPAPDDQVVRELVDYVAANLSADLTTKALARRAGVSERHLARLFAQHLGSSPGRYVRRARLEGAAHLLVSTTLPMSVVARRCGFASAETLRQAFEARLGTSPSQYRRSMTSVRGDLPA